MKPSLVLLAALAIALSGTGSEGKTAKTRRSDVRSTATRPAPSAPGQNINVPSTDFSTVEEAGAGPASRSRQGTMRPAMTEGGQLGLGTGF